MNPISPCWCCVPGCMNPISPCWCCVPDCMNPISPCWCCVPGCMNPISPCWCCVPGCMNPISPCWCCVPGCMNPISPCWCCVPGCMNPISPYWCCVPGCMNPISPYWCCVPGCMNPISPCWCCVPGCMNPISPYWCCVPGCMNPISPCWCRVSGCMNPISPCWCCVPGCMNPISPYWCCVSGCMNPISPCWCCVPGCMNPISPCWCCVPGCMNPISPCWCCVPGCRHFVILVHVQICRSHLIEMNERFVPHLQQNSPHNPASSSGARPPPCPWAWRHFSHLQAPRLRILHLHDQATPEILASNWPVPERVSLWFVREGKKQADQSWQTPLVTKGEMYEATANGLRVLWGFWSRAVSTALGSVALYFLVHWQNAPWSLLLRATDRPFHCDCGKSSTTTRSPWTARFLARRKTLAVQIPCMRRTSPQQGSVHRGIPSGVQQLTESWNVATGSWCLPVEFDYSCNNSYSVPLWLHHESRLHRKKDNDCTLRHREH